MRVWSAYNAVNAQITFSLFGFFGQNVTLKTFLVGDFAGARYFKTLFGTGICFNLWHVVFNI